MAIYMMREYVPPELCFTAEQANSTVQLYKYWNPVAVTLETSTDWQTWDTYTIWDTITLSNIWDKVYWRNTSETDTWFTDMNNRYYRFVMTWSIAWSWDVTYLLNKNGTDTVSNYCFYGLFQNCTSLTSAPSLPATTLWAYCYTSMFRGCTNLTTTPLLPATTLVQYCYNSMFLWCTSLKTLTPLSASTLDKYCCSQMFQDCTWLEQIPILPATTLITYCYYRMFYNCSKIKLSASQTWDYQTSYRIPTEWTWTTASNALTEMFNNTWWTFTWKPTINTTYYTSNTVV